MEVKEEYANISTSVSFSDRVSYPNEFYRVMVARKIFKSQPSVPLNDLVEGILGNYKQQAEGYGSIPIEDWRTNTIIDGKNAVLVSLSQPIPLRQGSNSGATHHILYIVECSDGGGVVLSIQWPHPCDACVNGPEEDILLTNERIEGFVKSFRLHSEI